MIKFLSNHKETTLVEILHGEEVQLIPHPYIQPSWSVADLRRECAAIIADAVSCEKLIINGDYTLVALIAIERFKLGKKTGYVCFEKIGASQAVKQADGTILHSNVLRAVNVRWL